MTEEESYDLSGQWTGFYNYPVPEPPVTSGGTETIEREAMAEVR